MPRTKRGFTLIEILIATVVLVLIMGAITSVFYYLLVIPPQQTDQLNAENQLRLSLDWIQNDGVQAHSFTANVSSCDTSPYLDSDYYGFFSSYASASCANPDCPEIRIAYRYDNASKQLIREKALWEGTSAGCDIGTINTTTIAFNVVDMGSVIFDCGGDDSCVGNHPMTVNMTVTLNPNSQNNVRKEILITDTRYIEMRADP